MPSIPDRPTIAATLDQRAGPAGIAQDWPYLHQGGESLSVAALDTRAHAIAAMLASRGVGMGDRVALMLDNHFDHVATFFALIKLGAVVIPVNCRLRAAGLGYILEHGDPVLVIAEHRYRDELSAAVSLEAMAPVLWRGRSGGGADEFTRAVDDGTERRAPDRNASADDIICILYTSGTTGPPKGVLVTDKMLRAAAHACALTAEARAGDAMYLWEPLYHVGGLQVILLALDLGVSVHLAERFSASRFWTEVRQVGATQIHYLGAVLQLLLKQPPRDDDRDHAVRVAYGGGAPRAVWKPFERRFGVRIREIYGMTEASSFTTLNPEGRYDCVGRPAPWFEVLIASDDQLTVEPGVSGEIVVEPREPGLLTPGYFRNQAATAAALKGGRLYTGDYGCLDKEGYLHYLGRLKDAMRIGGENVSAWEIERVVEEIDWVAESAAIGVPDELGDEAIKLFVRPSSPEAFDVHALFDWCQQRLASFQIPRFVVSVAAFDRTATERIKKDGLSRSAAGDWERARDGTLTERKR